MSQRAHAARAVRALPLPATRRTTVECSVVWKKVCFPGRPSIFFSRSEEAPSNHRFKPPIPSWLTRMPVLP